MFFFFIGNSSLNYNSEDLPQPTISLQNIPQILIASGKKYELRGVGCFRRGLSRLRTSIGHYYACCKRGNNKWEVYDDVAKNVKYINAETRVPVEFFVYTI